MKIRNDKGVVLYDSNDDRAEKDLDSIDLSGRNLQSAVPENLPGIGRDYAARVRRCIAECVKAGGCSPSKVP